MYGLVTAMRVLYLLVRHHELHHVTLHHHLEERGTNQTPTKGVRHSPNALSPRQPEAKLSR